MAFSATLMVILLTSLFLLYYLHLSPASLRNPLPHFPYQLTCVHPFLLTLLSFSPVFTFLPLLKNPFFPVVLIRWLIPCYASLHSSTVPPSCQWFCFICLVSVVSTSYALTSEDLEFLTSMRENVWCLHFWIWVSGLSHSVWSFLISSIYLQRSWFHFKYICYIFIIHSPVVGHLGCSLKSLTLVLLCRIFISDFLITRYIFTKSSCNLYSSISYNANF